MVDFVLDGFYSGKIVNMEFLFALHPGMTFHLVLRTGMKSFQNELILGQNHGNSNKEIIIY